MNPLRCFPSSINAHPTDAPLIDSTPAPRPASQVCMGLVWQALARVKSATLQVVRHLDCRQGLPADSLEPPSSYAPVSSTPVDADTPVPVAVQVAVHEVVEMVADAGAAPDQPAESSEPAAEELPHDAPPSPAPSSEAPSPLKSIALPQQRAKRTRSVTVTDREQVFPIPARPRSKQGSAPAPVAEAPDEDSPSDGFFVDTTSLDYRLPALSSSHASVEAFKEAVQTHVFWLSSHADNWSDPEQEHSPESRQTILDNTLQELKELAQAVERLKTDLESGQAGDMDAGDAQRLLEFLDDKKLDLRTNEARVNGLKLELEFLQKKPVASATTQPSGPSSSETSTDDDSACGYQGLDFSGLDAFSRGGAGFIVKSMRGDIANLLDDISVLKDEAGERGQTLVGQALAVEGIVEKLGALHDVLTVNLDRYIGRDNEFQEWMYGKMDDVAIELEEWARALDRLKAQQGAGPQPG